MPVRTIRSSYRSLTGRRSSGKSIGSAQSESSLERDLLITLDFNIFVKSYEVQPVKIKYLNANGAAATYTPDVLVVFRNDFRSIGVIPPLLIEVKHREELHANRSQFIPRFKAAIEYARNRSWQFRIYTEYEIRSIFFQNARFLLEYQEAYLAGNCDFDMVELLLHLLGKAKKPTVMGLMMNFQDSINRGRALYTLWQLIAIEEVKTNLEGELLTMESNIWL